MRVLGYPFDAEQLMRKRKSLRKKLLEDPTASWVNVKIAFLGGQTTRDILLMTELFLLNRGIRPTFYESEFNRYYEDGMFPNPELEAFAPDVIYLCTCVRDIPVWPEMGETEDAVAGKRDELAHRARAAGIRTVFGYYFPTAKNGMIRDFYARLGFTKHREDEDENTVWMLDLSKGYEKKQSVIRVREG